MPALDDALDDAVGDLVDELERAGLDPHALVVARDGAVLARAAWAPYATDHAALVYSVSKSVTALAVLLLAHEGRLGLDDPVHRHVDLPNPHGITLRQLLTMTTGHSREQTLAMPVDPRVLLTTAPAHPVGTRFAYSSPATATLARVVAAVAGSQPSAYLRPRLLDPVGVGPRWWTPLDDVEQGFSGLHLTVEDQARLGTALAGGSAVLPASLVTAVATTFVPTVATGAHDAGAEPDPTAPDWARGYGYGVWASRHGFRMDGAYGQFTLVVPETGVVVAYQGATTDTQRTLDALWRLVEVAGDRDAAGMPVPRTRDSWDARDRLVPAGGSDATGPDSTGWSLTDRGPDAWRLTLPATDAEPGGSLDVDAHRWTRGTLAPLAGPGVVPVAARAERRPDGSVLAHLVCTASPHRVLLTRSPAGDLRAHWHTAPLWQPALSTLLVPERVSAPAPGVP